MLYEETKIDSLWQDFYLSEFVVVWSGSALFALSADKLILKDTFFCLYEKGGLHNLLQ